ncbi:MAG: response regulator transcription factor [Polaribacter sp.]|nr:response regulator transcription factor [Polaribacter sp.]
MINIKTVIIDSDESSLTRLETLLTKFHEVEVLGTFVNPIDGLDFILKNEIDVAFVQIEMPSLSGLELAEEISKREAKVKIIFISDHTHYAIKAIKVSVFDYLLKPISIDEVKVSLQRFSVKYKMNLNSKEMQIIRNMSDGLNSKLIGEKLFISKHTVDKYRRNILEKTNCSNTAELVRFATQTGII